MQNYRVLVSAGDASGDLILSKVIAELKAHVRPEVKLEFVGLCGPACQEQGVLPIGNTKDVSVVGLVEVLRNIKKIFGTLGLLAKQLPQVQSVICVDFPDFNFRLSQMAEKNGRPVDYIVAPQVWAWRSGRLQVMKRFVRKLYPALPFEENIFREAGIAAKYLGHPMRDLLPPRNRRQARSDLGIQDEFVFCLMPGSRRSEIRRHLALLVDAWALFKKRHTLSHQTKKFKVLLPLAPGWTENDLLELVPQAVQNEIQALKASGEWTFVKDSRQALMASDFGWITSGTATLEAAYYQLPHILLYKLNRFSVFVLSQVSEYFRNPEAAAGLPNILVGRKIFPELLQNDLSSQRLATETFELLQNPTRLNEIQKYLRWIPKKLGEPGPAKRIALDLLATWNLL